MEIHRIQPLKDLGPLLLKVEKPARYTGGEYGRLCKPLLLNEESALKTVIAFPDLYEIGMSNQALRILYNSLNKVEGILCDRAFAPAPDFEELLREKGLPLYGLETGISLKESDITMFTLGYELSLTGILAMLDISGIPLRCGDRSQNDPVILAGGPCVSNPLPYSNFIDAFWIGEAESGFFDLARELGELKKAGGNRQQLLDLLCAHQSVWTKGKGRALRAIDTAFSKRKDSPAVFPIPSMKVVHHHGAVEIMRGCPNGCRFCHAGYWYRPMRQKDSSLVEAEAEAFIKQGGYREITLSSLSSGDYSYVDSLIDTLNGKFKDQNVSFQLPSLKVSSFSLDLLEKISEVRKSGLTFAVETPSDFWQMAINKQVSVENLVSILKEAKRRGWHAVKFYFMIGLPLDNGIPETEKLLSEEEEIILFVENISKRTGMRFNINIGTYIPKPHTPFQRAQQISREESEKKLYFLRSKLKTQGHKIGIQDPLISVIEGTLSRGDERAGELFERAFKLGCRLDSWSEYIKRDIWEELLVQNKNLVDEIFMKKDPVSVLPWKDIKSGVSDTYFEDEYCKSRTGEITSPCIINCKNPCGVCTKSSEIVHNNMQEKAVSNKISSVDVLKKADPDTYRIIFSFSKQGSAVFHPHLSLLEIFSMAFIRAGIPILYTQGYNPLPKMEIASPLSLGIKARAEVMIIDTIAFMDSNEFKIKMNSMLPEGLEINNAMNVYIPSGEKKYSISSMLWGFEYSYKGGSFELVKAREEKEYRNSKIDDKEDVYFFERISVLAKDITQKDTELGLSYFDVYRSIYH